MLAIVPSAVLDGIDGRPVRVEVHVSNGIPGFTVVGLPDTACRESRDRVRAALLSSSLPWILRRVTVNLAPSGLRKQGAGLDLAIAIGLLVAAGELPADACANRAFIGELGLDGRVRPVAGMVPLVDAIAAEEVVVAAASAAHAELVGRHKVRAVRTLAEVAAALRGDEPWPDIDAPPLIGEISEAAPDLAEVHGQRVARLALEVAAAGGHHLLFVGPPGAGKTMLAKRLPGLLPDLDDEQALLTTRIHSAAGLPLPARGLVRRPPYRAPHHGASAVALIGGGSVRLRPGEVSLATNGVLFLDELGEFPRSVLDALRQPVEDGVVRVTRAIGSATFPARFLLVAATNPCPCGNGGAPGSCRCSDVARLRYAQRLAGPLADRFDLRVEVPKPDPVEILSGTPGESSAVVGARVAQVRALSRERGVRSNAEIPGSLLDVLAPMTPIAVRLLDAALRTGMLSGRGLHRVRRVARTIADLDGRDGTVTEEDIGLALQLRANPEAYGVAG